MAKGNPHKDVDEAALIRAVLSGAASAWPAFMERYERLIASCVRKVLVRYRALQTEEDVEDLISATVVNIVKDDYKKLRAFDPGRGVRLSSWIGLLATNTAHDALRQRPPPASSLDRDGSACELSSDAEDPEERILLEQRARHMEQAISQLSESEQLFVRYYFEDELEPEEIARLMKISINTVYSRKNKVREKLRRIVEEREHLEDAPRRLRNTRQE